MKKYINSVNPIIREYFKILCPSYPEWLEEYINTKEMLRLGKISMNCGTDYSGLFHIDNWYSTLDHSVGVSLIVWDYTHDKKQTLAGLFHDIATPVFKHTIDFMNGDYCNQESTEEKTSSIIENSNQIVRLLKRDNIKFEEINDYKIYPIADNKSPRLSADRFEYTFSSGMFFYHIWDLDAVAKFYINSQALSNEEGQKEIGFYNSKIGEEYINYASKLWPAWIDNKNKLSMQFLADVTKIMINSNVITMDDLYTLSEEEVIDIILNCDLFDLKNKFQCFQKSPVFYESIQPIEGKYNIHFNSKMRYVNPLVLIKNSPKRIYDVSNVARNKINEFLKLRLPEYAALDFNFNPNQYIRTKK